MDALIGIIRALLIALGFIRKPIFLMCAVAEHPSPAQIEPGVIYVVGGPGYTKWAYLRCPTGNGDVIQLSLQPKHRPRWDVTKDWLGRPTIRPSVRQMDGSYAHFWVRRGAVHWCADTGRPPMLTHGHWQAYQGSKGAIMSKGRDRTVFRRGDDWINKRNDSDRASSIHDTQGEAEHAAREMLRNQGGGELTTQGRDGRFRSKDTIYPGNDPYPPEDREH